MFLAAVALAAVLTVGTQAAEAQTAASDDSTPAVSIERVREGLERPNVLKLPNLDEMAYFRAVVEEALAIDGALDAMRRELAARPGYPIAPPTYRLASLAGGVDLIGVARSLLRARAERNARRTVQEALDEFCSTHDCSILEGETPIEGVTMPRFQSDSPARTQ